MIDIPCILFAGGKSSRMGSDKALLPFGGCNSLSEYQYKRLRALFKEVYISAKSAEKFDFTCKVLEDPKASEFAPTAGFVAAFEALHAERIFVLSVDTPFVDDAVIHTLLQADTPKHDAVIAKSASGTHPMCGIYHRSLFESFKTMLQTSEHRLGKLLSQSQTHYVAFQDEHPFANLNHPHEYDEALQRIGTSL